MPQTWVQYDKTLPYIENREPFIEPTCYLKKDGINTYKVVEGRRPTDMLLVKKLREEVKKWRDLNYPGATETTKELFSFWFQTDHILDHKLYNYWFCQQEAIETLVFLFEVKKYNDLAPLIEDFSEKTRVDILGDAVEIVQDNEGNRKVVRYFPELGQRGEQALPPEGLLRYAFKMATGSGKTYVMALLIVWSYLNSKRENNDKYADNFLLIAPNVIVYERLEKDFANNRIFKTLPLIPPAWKSLWDMVVTLREEEKPLQPSGNLVLTNIHQLYGSREEEWSPINVVDAILGKKPQKDLAKHHETLLQRLKKLDNLIIINDEAHHVHDPSLEWHKTITTIHNTLPNGLCCWLDFSATPKTQTGTYFPWIIVDYPLAQAVEDRIVKAPLIVKKVDKKDPENINSDNVVKKYGDWVAAALDRWTEHTKVYQTVGKKPVLFIMTEKNQYADKIAEAISRQKNRWPIKNPEKEILVIHTDTSGDVKEKDLESLRKVAREVDEKTNPVKIIVSVLMLREGWDVKNVTIVLGLRPFTSKAEILPEQAIGRGLRLLSDISPEQTQTLEVMGTEAFEKFVKGLEKEGVGINTATKPPLPITITPEKSRLEYDIVMPTTEFRYSRNYKKISEVNIATIQSLYASKKLTESRRIELKMSFPVTETEVHSTFVTPSTDTDSRELIAYITREVMKRARLTCDFNIVYPITESYILQRCFERPINNIENNNLKLHLSDFSIQEAIIDLLAKKLGEITAEQKEIVLEQYRTKLSEAEPFLWRRKRIRCKKTVFNFVALYNNFEEEFAIFLNQCNDIERFSALANLFKIDYLGSNGAIHLYFPDFVAVHNQDGKRTFWIIETKGREFTDVAKKDEAIEKWCSNVTKGAKEKWKYLKVPQYRYDMIKRNCFSFSILLRSLPEY